ncbi:DUF3817 domain-containing protein [Humidisolicoccus flavus]|uniref:DUF3817 domain-containing protein n=1 Tax=Humidisolicoccus flavus TaxID=3111414 RepID=UPI00324F988E
MPLPKPQQLPKIRFALKFYQVFAWITGVFLLLVVVEMVAKYAFAMEIEAFGPFGLIALVPDGTTTAVNLSRVVLIVHGWLYVVYLIADFRLWILLRWPFWNLFLIALGGVVPLLSFFVEHSMSKRARADIAAVEAAAARPRRKRQDSQVNSSEGL